MFRIIFILLVALMVSLLYLQSLTMQTTSEKPIFLRTDEIANSHSTSIELKIHSHYQPVESEQETLKKDYSNIWAHLNHLYNTNDVETGKEYYTEGWFRQICNYNIKKIQAPIIRNDLQHSLHIQNWENDGLICTAIDSNVALKYTYPDSSVRTTKANIAVVLLYQGDHWRIDALKVISELKN